MYNSEQQVFISYAREDHAIAHRLYNDLKSAGLKPWLDKVDILPGQNWPMVTTQALQSSNYVLILLSSNSVSKRGYVQKEIKLALDILERYPADSIFVIPVRVEDCSPKDERLTNIHWADLFPSYETGLKQILRVFSDTHDSDTYDTAPRDSNDGLFKNIGDSWFDISQSSGNLSLRKKTPLEFEGQKLVGVILSIGPNNIDIDLKEFGLVTVFRPPQDLEICEPEIGDKIAVQIRDGQPMLQTAAQTLQVNGKQYYYGVDVTFRPEYYDPKIGLVIGKADNEVLAFAEILGPDGDLIVSSYQNNRSVIISGQKLSLPGATVTLSVLESVFYGGSWQLLLSSELHRRKASIIGSGTEVEEKKKLYQVSYLFDYLEHQTNLSCKVCAIHGEIAVVNLERLKETGEKINRFPVKINSPRKTGDTINLRNFGVIRERGQLSLYPPSEKINNITPDTIYEALMINKRGNEYCLSINIGSKKNYKKIPVIVESTNVPEKISSYPLFPFFSFVSITDILWDEKKSCYKGTLAFANVEELKIEEKRFGWVWYYSRSEEGGQLWGVNPSYGVWKPLYPYNHLLNLMGIPISNRSLLEYCEEKYDFDSIFKIERYSNLVGLKRKGHVYYDKDEFLLIIQNEPRKQRSFSAVEKGEIVEGKIINIDIDFVYVETELGITGTISSAEFSNLSDFRIGDTLEVFTSYETDHNNQLILSKTITDKVKSWERIKKIYENGEIVSGPVQQVNKGGLLLDLFGFSVFMPNSQIDLVSVKDPGALLGQDLDFKLLSLREKNSHTIVSRRLVLQELEETQKLARINQLEVGQICKGRIIRLVEFGAFIDLGGVNALLHISEMSWSVIKHPSELFTVGEEIEIIILSINRERTRIALGRKQLLPDPWSNAKEKYAVGTNVTGKVVRILKYGIFIELEEGIVGLLHRSETFEPQSKRDLSELFLINESVELKIIAFDENKRRIGLSQKTIDQEPLIEQDKLLDVKEKYPIGLSVRGEIMSISSNGLVIAIEDELEGFIPKEKIGLEIYHPSLAFQVGDMVDAKIVSYNKPGQPLGLSIVGYLHELDAGSLLKWKEEHPISRARYKKASVTRIMPKVGIEVADENGRIGFITRNLLENFQLACVKVGDLIEVYEEGTTNSGKHLRFGMVPNPENFWPASLQDKYPIGLPITGEILQIFHYGLYVKLEKNVIGVIAVGDLVKGGQKLEKVRRSYKIGDKVQFCIKSVDPQTQKIILSTLYPAEHQESPVTKIIPLPTPIEGVFDLPEEVDQSTHVYEHVQINLKEEGDVPLPNPLAEELSQVLGKKIVDSKGQRKEMKSSSTRHVVKATEKLNPQTKKNGDEPGERRIPNISQKDSVSPSPKSEVALNITNTEAQEREGKDAHQLVPLPKNLPEDA